SVGQSFDPNRHEAMMSEQGDCDEPVVVEEYMKGYMLRERVLRSAKVKVRMPAAKTGADTATE
ncbi:MAG TPA: nucleotide exchange factor GrpE, partial [Spirochaetales bacterium]|nr:nucleotide exchange factor GrpE [Spirochaetales bacterium]